MDRERSLEGCTGRILLRPCLLLEHVHPAQLPQDLACEQHPFLVQQLVAFLHQSPFLLQLEEGDPGGEQFADALRHRAALAGGA